MSLSSTLDSWRREYEAQLAGRVPPEDVVLEALSIYSKLSSEEDPFPLLERVEGSDAAKWLAYSALQDPKVRDFLLSRKLDPDDKRILGQVRAIISSVGDAEKAIREEIQEAIDTGSSRIEFILDRDDMRLHIYKDGDRLTRDAVIQIISGLGYSSKFVDPRRREEVQVFLARALVEDKLVSPKEFIEMGGVLGAFGVGSTFARMAIAGGSLDRDIVFRSGRKGWSIPVRALYLPARERSRMLREFEADEVVEGSIISIPVDTTVRDAKGNSIGEDLIEYMKGVLDSWSVAHPYSLFDITVRFAMIENGELAERIVKRDSPRFILNRPDGEGRLWNFSSEAGFPLVIVTFPSRAQWNSLLLVVDGAVVGTPVSLPSIEAVVFTDSIQTTNNRTSINEEDERWKIVRNYAKYAALKHKIDLGFTGLQEVLGFLNQAQELPKDLYRSIEGKLRERILEVRIPVYLKGESAALSFKDLLSGNALVVVSPQEFSSYKSLLDLLSTKHGLPIVIADFWYVSRVLDALSRMGMTTPEVMDLSGAVDKYDLRTKHVILDVQGDNANILLRSAESILLSRATPKPVRIAYLEDAKGLNDGRRILLSPSSDPERTPFHELAHNEHKDHDIHFWKRMTELMGDAIKGYRKYPKWRIEVASLIAASLLLGSSEYELQDAVDKLRTSYLEGEWDQVIDEIMKFVKLDLNDDQISALVHGLQGYDVLFVEPGEDGAKLTAHIIRAVASMVRASRTASRASLTFEPRRIFHFIDSVKAEIRKVEGDVHLEVEVSDGNDLTVLRLEGKLNERLEMSVVDCGCSDGGTLELVYEDPVTLGYEVEFLRNLASELGTYLRITGRTG